MKLLLCALTAMLAIAFGGTSIQVSNSYKKEINVKIGGAGLGGCDVLLQPGEANTNDCWCLWGTLNYAFCAYVKSPVGAPTALPNTNATSGQGRCPIITGESLVCSDIDSLGNCYDKAYSCSIDETGLCHCHTV